MVLRQEADLTIQFKSVKEGENMAMEINGGYGNYASTYTNPKETKQTKETAKASEKQTCVEKAEQAEKTRKTAADELDYLKSKFDGFTFVAANYSAANFSPSKSYGTLATTNIAISPDFLKKMANDSELEKQYEEEFENMKRLDEQNIKSHEAQGRRLIAQGWVIDKNGDMSKWGISEATNKRHYGQEMTDYADKIRKQKSEKKKEQEKLSAKQKEKAEQKEALEEKKKADRESLKEQIDSVGKELLGNKYKGSEWFDASGEIISVESEKGTNGDDVVGLNMDMKL